MKVLRLQILLCVMLLSACETVRTVYDESGNVVTPETSSGGEKDLTEHLNKQFNSAFSTQKTESGVPRSVSNKVSSFQRKLDEAGRLDKEFITSAYAGARGSYSTGAYADEGKRYLTNKEYADSRGKQIERDMHPDFAKPSRGIFGTDDAYALGDMRSPLQGRRNSAKERVYATGSSSYSRETTSGYVETRRDRTPPPRVYTRDEYYGKTIEDTRTLLGRDKEGAEE